MALPGPVLREDREGAAFLTLNNPDKRNALSREMIESLQRQLDAVGADPSVRVVVLSGAGPAFCAGHDLREMRQIGEEESLRALFRQCSRMMMTLRRIPQPVLARVHGLATAAGCQLVAMCDLVVAAEEATFAVSGINVGLFCSTPGVALSRQVAPKHALEMLLTGEFIDARAAERKGLVNRVVPTPDLDREIADLVRVIAAKSPVAVASGKRMFYEQVEMDLAAAYEHAGEVMARDMMSEDAAEGIDAFLEKRTPRWRGR